MGQAGRHACWLTLQGNEGSTVARRSTATSEEGTAAGTAAATNGRYDGYLLLELEELVFDVGGEGGFLHSDGGVRGIGLHPGL